MLETILVEVASRSSFTSRLSLSTLGVDVDRLPYPMHRPMARNYQAKGQDLSVRHGPILLLQ
jgi:hypothetical protein